MTNKYYDITKIDRDAVYNITLLERRHTTMTIDYEIEIAIFKTIKRQRDMLEDITRLFGANDPDTVREQVKYNGMVELLDELGIYDDYEKFLYKG